MNKLDEEGLMRLLGELRDYTLIVEGAKDERALKTLGLINIVPISGRPVSKVVENLDGGRSVVILTDFDSEGKRIAASLLRHLQRRGIKANPRLRWMFMNVTRISRIEELATCSEVALIKEKGDIHGEIGANFYEVYNKSKYKGKRHC